MLMLFQSGKCDNFQMQRCEPQVCDPNAEKEKKRRCQNVNPEKHRADGADGEKRCVTCKTHPLCSRWSLIISIHFHNGILRLTAPRQRSTLGLIYAHHFAHFSDTLIPTQTKNVIDETRTASSDKKLSNLITPQIVYLY